MRTGHAVGAPQEEASTMSTRTQILAAIAAAFLAGTASAGTLYGISNGFGTPANNAVYQIDPATGAVSNSVQVTLPGFTVVNSTAMAAHPVTGELWAVIQTSDIVRRLVRIDPATGVATQIGPLAKQIATLAFKADGTLLGVTGDGSLAPAETLFIISTTNAVLTQLFTLGNGDDGETIAVHPSGLVYHSSGNGIAVFESVDLATQVVTPIGTASGEAFGMGWSTSLSRMYLSDINSDLFTVDLATGARTLVGHIPSPDANRGLAFVEITSATPFCSGDGSGAACPCGNNGIGGNGCASSANAGGANLSATGLASLAGDTLVLTGTGMPNSSALYFQGTTQVQGGLGVAFGDGLRCAGGTIVRLGTKTNAGGASHYPGAGDPSVSVRGQVALPGTRTYQVWYRNAAAFCTSSTFNLSNGLQVAWGP
jgi:hypothetical protein